jgi:hypothetical protein
VKVSEHLVGAPPTEEAYAVGVNLGAKEGCGA